MRTTFDFRMRRMIHVRWGSVESVGPLTVGPVKWDAKRKRWACYWSIHRIHDHEHRIHGEDPIQAITRTLRFMEDFIRGSISDGIVMWWQFEGDECGFVRFGPDEIGERKKA